MTSHENVEVHHAPNKPSHVKIRTSDGEITVVDRETYLKCKSILKKITVSDYENDGTLEFKNVSSFALEKVMSFCRSRWYPPELPTHDDHRGDDIGRRGGTRNTPPEEMNKTEYEKILFKEDAKVLCELASAAYYLEVKPFVDVTCRAIAETIKGKSPEQIRTTFNIHNDFLSHEEDQVKRSVLESSMFSTQLLQYSSGGIHLDGLYHSHGGSGGPHGSNATRDRLVRKLHARERQKRSERQLHPGAAKKMNVASKKANVNINSDKTPPHKNNLPSPPHSTNNKTAPPPPPLAPSRRKRKRRKKKKRKGNGGEEPPPPAGGGSHGGGKPRGWTHRPTHHQQPTQQKSTVQTPVEQKSVNEAPKKPRKKYHPSLARLPLPPHERDPPATKNYEPPSPKNSSPKNYEQQGFIQIQEKLKSWGYSLEDFMDHKEHATMNGGLTPALEFVDLAAAANISPKNDNFTQEDDKGFLVNNGHESDPSEGERTTTSGSSPPPPFQDENAVAIPGKMPQLEEIQPSTNDGEKKNGRILDVLTFAILSTRQQKKDFQESSSPTLSERNSGSSTTPCFHQQVAQPPSTHPRNPNRKEPIPCTEFCEYVEWLEQELAAMRLLQASAQIDPLDSNLVGPRCFVQGLTKRQLTQMGVPKEHITVEFPVQPRRVRKSVQMD